jgi:hypothetical protein
MVGLGSADLCDLQLDDFTEMVIEASRQKAAPLDK